MLDNYTDWFIREALLKFEGSDESLHLVYPYRQKKAIHSGTIVMEVMKSENIEESKHLDLGSLKELRSKYEMP